MHKHAHILTFSFSHTHIPVCQTALISRHQGTKLFSLVDALLSGSQLNVSCVTFGPLWAVCIVFSRWNQQKLQSRMTHLTQQFNEGTDPSAVWEPVLPFYWFDQCVSQTWWNLWGFQAPPPLELNKQIKKIWLPSMGADRGNIWCWVRWMMLLCTLLHNLEWDFGSNEPECVWSVCESGLLKYCSHPGPPSTTHTCIHTHCYVISLSLTTGQHSM